MPLTLDDQMIRILTDPAALREHLAASIEYREKMKAAKREYYHRNKDAINARRQAKYRAAKDAASSPPLSGKMEGMPIV